jgi:SAM-dependent methyltransferase
MPFSHQVEFGAAKGFYHYPTAGPEKGGCRVRHLAPSGSILTANFNRAWAHALNHRKMYGVTHFAMLHSDVCPEPFWLDKLLAELTRLDADVVSAVVPIKTKHGLTSTAVGTDNTYLSRRLTLREAHQLPETFDHTDVAFHLGVKGPLLINTGCWVADLSKPWCDECDERGVLKWCFNVRDRIVRDPATGDFEGQSYSEDWQFGEYLHSIGAKVYATRKVRLDHAGAAGYANDRPWGEWETDETFRRANREFDLPTHWRYPVEVQGWLSLPEAMVLAHLAEGGRVCEIGSYEGKSTIAMAQTAARVVSIDHHKGDKGTGPADTLERFGKNLSDWGVRDKVTAYAADVNYVAPNLESGSFDLVYVDAQHDYQSTLANLLHALRLVKPGGVIVAHDCHYPEVMRAIEDSGLKKGPSGEGGGDRVDSLWWTKV